MKKIFNLTKRALFLIICLAFIAGCSGSSGSSSDDDTGSIDTEIADDTEGTEETDDNDYYGILVINEIMAKDAGGGNDWIEFFAVGGNVFLGDYSVVDDDPDHEPQALPDIYLPEGAFYVIEAIDADDGCPDGSGCVSFKLGSDDSVTLFQDDVQIDFLDWTDGQAGEGYSYGILPDGTGTAQTLSPTKGTANEASTDTGGTDESDDADEIAGDDAGGTTDTVEDTFAAIVINEIVAKAADGGDDWIEFYVSGTETINLSDYTVVDDNAENELAALPTVILSPGEFYVVRATDEAPEDGSAYVPFKLGSDDCVSLFKGDDLIDRLDWEDGDALIGYSYGCFPDGSENTQTLSPTSGYPNETADNEPIDFFLEDTVEDVYITISQTDWNSILSSPLAEEYHTASITYRNTTLDNVAFRTKGNSSLRAVAQMNSTRYSFKVDMNYYVDGQKLLGMKKINLNNNYKDPSYMRECIAYEMLRSLDVPTPRLSYVNLYINGSHHGLYTLVEQVDSEFLEENFDNPDGDLYKPDGTGSDLLWRGASFTSYSGVELKTNEETSDNAAFINMINELNNGSDIESVIDVDGMLRYLAVSTALSNLDSYQGSLAHNYYIYEQDGVFSIIPWDFNESFGSFTMGCQDSNAMITLYIDEPTSGALADRPLIAKLLKIDRYKDTYHEYIEDVIYGVMNSSVISRTIEETENLISAHVASDPTAFYSYSEFQAALGYGMVGTIFGLQGFADDRTSNIMEQLAGTEPSEGDGSGSCGSGTPGGRPGRF